MAAPSARSFNSASSIRDQASKPADRSAAYVGVRAIPPASRALTSEATLDELADLAARCLARQGDPRFKSAASILRGPPPGAPALDDTEALAEMKLLLESGEVSGVRDAARWVAYGMSRDDCQLASVVRRLCRKFVRS